MNMINLNDKTFISLVNSENGEVSDKTSFYYKQKDHTIWAEYEGGDIVKGTLLGKITNEHEFEFCYQHLSKDGNIKAGHCKTTVSILEPGKIKLSENWQWFTGDQSKGYSELVEI